MSIVGHPQEESCAGTVALGQILFSPYSAETSARAHGRFPELTLCVFSGIIFVVHRNCSPETLYNFQLIPISHLLLVWYVIGMLF